MDTDIGKKIRIMITIKNRKWPASKIFSKMCDSAVRTAGYPAQGVPGFDMGSRGVIEWVNVVSIWEGHSCLWFLSVFGSRGAFQHSLPIRP
jgi:hypothetical protein